MPPSPPGPSVCENCAGEDEDLTSVWPGGDDTSGTPQLWCPECVARYPNETAGEDETDDDEGAAEAK